MKHPLLKLGAALTLALSIASCGGGGAPTPEPDKKPPVAEQPKPGDETAPVVGGTISKPEGTTAANEFVVTGVRGKVLANSLGFDTATVQTVMAGQGGIRAQAVENELRILVAVTRSKSGSSAGKKKAVATFVWGNQTEKVLPLGTVKDQPGVTLDIFPQGNEAAKTTYTGGLDLRVESPNFQDKTTRSGPYVNDTGAMCARLVFDLTTAPNTGTGTGYAPLLFNNADSALEVCEGDSERNAEKLALEKASKGLMFDYESETAAPFTYGSTDGLTTLPQESQVWEDAASIFGLSIPQSANVDSVTLDEFFAPLIELPAGDSATWTPEQKAQAAAARKYITLKKQFGYYYRSTRVYRAYGDGGRVDILILGLNGWGVGGLRTIQFAVPAPPSTAQ